MKDEIRNIPETNSPTAVNSAAANPPSRTRRRWLQYSLRSLFILTTICAILACIAGRWLQQIRDEENATAEIEVKSTFAIVQVELYNAGDALSEGVEPPRWFCRIVGQPDIKHVKAIQIIAGDSFNDVGERREEIQQLTKRLMLAASMPGLRKVRIYSDKLCFDCLQGLLGNPYVEEIEFVSDMDSIDTALDEDRRKTSCSKETFEDLATLPNLRKLELWRLPISSAGYRGLSRLRNVKDLRLIGCNLADEDLKSIGELQSLEELTIFSAEGLDRIRDGSFFPFEPGTRPKSARLATSFADSRVTDVGLRELKSLPRLHSLWIDGYAINGQGFDALAILPLTDISLSSSMLDNAGLKTILSCRTLQSVHVAGGKVSSVGLEGSLSDTSLKSMSINSFEILLQPDEKATRNASAGGSLAN